MALGNIFFGSDVEQRVKNYLSNCTILDDKYEAIVNGPKNASGKYDVREMQHFIDAVNNYDIDADAFAIMTLLVVMDGAEKGKLTPEEIDQISEYNQEIEERRSKIAEYVKEIKGQLGIA